MYIVGGVYKFLYDHGGYHFINFGIVKMAFSALDKTIIYFLLWLILRSLFNILVRKKHFVIKRELLLSLFVFYLLFLLFFTVFRKGYWPWQFSIDYKRSLSDVNWIPFVQTLKMTKGLSLVPLVYNCLGNILMFLPLGIMMSALKNKPKRKLLIFLSGALISLFIETSQFLLHTGQADIDDLIFNSLGFWIGMCIYFIFTKSPKKRHKKSH